MSESMGTENFVSNLQKVGWKDFAPGEFLDVDFDQIGKAKIAHNNWFVLVKSLPVLDGTALQTWNQTYQTFTKKAHAGFVTSGKYFVLILMVDSIGPDVLQNLSGGGKLDFLEMPKSIRRGGGYVLLLVKDLKKILMPQTIILDSILSANEWNKQTFMALDAYKNSLSDSAKTAYAVVWTKEQLAREHIVPTLGTACRQFAAYDAEFRALFEGAVAARSDIHVINRILTPIPMRSFESMADQFYGLLREKGVSALPSIKDDVYHIEFQDSSGEYALAWCYFK